MAPPGCGISNHILNELIDLKNIEKYIRLAILKKANNVDG
jgi:hypothetical protein